MASKHMKVNTYNFSNKTEALRYARTHGFGGIACRMWLWTGTQSQDSARHGFVKERTSRVDKRSLSSRFEHLPENNHF